MTDSPSPQRLNAPNREAWLVALVDAWRPLIKKLGALPEIRITCGFPSKRGLARQRLAIGECWRPQYSVVGRVEIFVSPLIDDPFEVAHVVLHELVHAVIGCEHGHRAAFKRATARVGLIGRPTSTVPGEELAAYIRQSLLPDLGPYPHAKLAHPEVKIEIGDDRGKETARVTTRLIKVVCDNCGYVARVTRKWIIHPGPPICPCSDNQMTVERRR